MRNVRTEKQKARAHGGEYNNTKKQINGNKSDRVEIGSHYMSGYIPFILIALNNQLLSHMFTFARLQPLQDFRVRDVPRYYNGATQTEPRANRVLAQHRPQVAHWLVQVHLM